MKWGYILIGVSILILLTVLYGQNRRREEFTTMKGEFPNYETLLDQVRLLLDKGYDYDLSELKKMANDQTEMYHKAFDDFIKNRDLTMRLDPLTALDINTQMNPKTPSYIGEFLPKGFKLNVDTPFDSKIAILYAQKQMTLTAMKQPTASVKPGKLPYDRAIKQYYKTEGEAALMKNQMLATLIEEAMIRTRAKPKPSDFTSVISK
jgi:hypothetical protein